MMSEFMPWKYVSLCSETIVYLIHLICLPFFRFVKMALPRSVKEMSKLDFLPKHCESDNFRGFSFIGDAFPLPERTVSF